MYAVSEEIKKLREIRKLKTIVFLLPTLFYTENAIRNQ